MVWWSTRLRTRATTATSCGTLQLRGQATCGPWASKPRPRATTRSQFIGTARAGARFDPEPGSGVPGRGHPVGRPVAERRRRSVFERRLGSRRRLLRDRPADRALEWGELERCRLATARAWEQPRFGSCDLTHGRLGGWIDDRLDRR